MKALILAAGYGTRLYPLTRKYPKALLPVAGRPILDYIVEKLAKIKHISAIVIVTNGKFFSDFALWAGGLRSKNPSLNLKILNDGTKTENDRLGALGDIDFAISRENIKEDILIVGGDNLFEQGLTGFVKFASALRPRVAIGVYDIRKRGLARKYGVVTLDAKDGRIIDFAEKPAHPATTLIATCLYYITKEKLGYFREYLRDSRNERDASGNFISWLSGKDKVYGFVFRQRWYDIGDPQAYKEADNVFARLRKEKE